MFPNVINLKSTFTKYKIQIVEFAAIVAGMVFLGNQVFNLVFAPNIFMDEGYYLGATHQILSGDIFMRTYSFDKPFMVALWPLPGIWLFGENPFGFHFVPLVFFFSSFVLFYQSIVTFGVKRISAFSLSLFLFTIPAFQSQFISNFCEPYLFFLTFLTFFLVARKAPMKWVSNVFFLGLFTKYSFLSVFPFIIVADMMKHGDCTVKRAVRFTKEFFASGKWTIAVWFAYLVLNQAPFKSITWFSAFSTYTAESPSFFNRVSNWVGALGDQFHYQGLFLLCILSITVGCVFSLIKFNLRQNLKLILVLISLFLSFLILPLSSAPVIGRYVLSVMPFLFMALAVSIGKSSFSAIVIAVIGLSYLYPVKRNPIDGNAELARNVYEVRSELNRNGVILHDDQLWVTTAFRDKLISSGCTSKECLDQFSNGVKHQPFQFMFKNGELSRILSDQTVVTDREIDSGITLKEVSAGLLSSMRLKKTVKVEEITTESGHSSDSRTLYDGSIINIRLSILKGLSGVIKQGDTATLAVKLWVHDLHDYPDHFNQPRFQLMGRFKSFKVKDLEMLDFIMPYFFKGYSIPISNLHPIWNGNRRLLSPVVRTDGRIHLREVVLKERT